MKRSLVLLGCALFGCDDGGLGALLQTSDAMADLPIEVMDAAADAPVQAMDAAADAHAEARDAAADAAPLPLPGAEDWPQFAFPIAEADRALLRTELILGVDHDPVDRGGVICTDYAGRNFPYCYDAHEGTDYLLTGGFDAMDRGSALVVAAAGGTIVRTEDGNYDRCHGSVDGGIDCDGHPMVANRIVIEHANGYRSHYLHLMSGSLLVAEGAVVDCGAPLARVGSSGRSAQPHLHFHVTGPAGELIDPYAGEFSQPEGYWAQPPTPESRLPGAACHPAWTRAPSD